VLASVGGVLGLALGAGAAKYMAGYFGWKFFFPATTAAIRILRRGWCRCGVRSVSGDRGVAARSDHGSEVRDMKLPSRLFAALMAVTAAMGALALGGTAAAQPA